jgi:hypothetical protein
MFSPCDTVIAPSWVEFRLSMTADPLKSCWETNQMSDDGLGEVFGGISTHPVT